MKKKAAIIISCLAALFLSACSYLPSANGDADSDGGEEGKITIQTTEEAMDKSNVIASPIYEGTLNYRITDCQLYQSFEETGISLSDSDLGLAIENMYYELPFEDYEQYQRLSDYITPDGSIIDAHRLVVLDLNIQNVDAVGVANKNEFLINDIALYGGEGEEVSVYSPAYFSEAGKVDPGNEAHVFHYILEQGEEMDVRLGFIVLEKEVESLKGAIVPGEEDVQFNIW